MLSPRSSRFIPEVLIGDLDSARPEVEHRLFPFCAQRTPPPVPSPCPSGTTPQVVEYYRGRGSDVCRVADQDSTDMMKALDLLARHEQVCHFLLPAAVTSANTYLLSDPRRRPPWSCAHHRTRAVPLTSSCAMAASVGDSTRFYWG